MVSLSAGYTQASTSNQCPSVLFNTHFGDCRQSDGSADLVTAEIQLTVSSDGLIQKNTCSSNSQPSADGINRCTDDFHTDPHTLRPDRKWYTETTEDPSIGAVTEYTRTWCTGKSLEIRGQSKQGLVPVGGNSESYQVLPNGNLEIKSMVRVLVLPFWTTTTCRPLVQN